jgi:hypothetical protein
MSKRWIDAKDEYDELERKEWAEQARIRNEAEKAKEAELAEDDDDMEGVPLPPGGSGIKIVRKNQ